MAGNSKMTKTMARTAHDATQQRDAALKLAFALERAVEAGRAYYSASVIVIERQGGATEIEHYQAALAAEKFYNALNAIPKAKKL